MNRFEVWALHLSTLLVGGTGLIYGWMRYFAEASDPFSLVNHPPTRFSAPASVDCAAARLRRRNDVAQPRLGALDATAGPGSKDRRRAHAHARADDSLRSPDPDHCLRGLAKCVGHDPSGHRNDLDREPSHSRLGEVEPAAAGERCHALGRLRPARRCDHEIRRRRGESDTSFDTARPRFLSWLSPLPHVGGGGQGRKVAL